MKQTGIDLIGSFEKKKDQNEQVYYTAQLNPTVFKKMKEEIHLILMPGDQLPPALVGTEQVTKDSLYLFSQTEQNNGKTLSKLG